MFPSSKGSRKSPIATVPSKHKRKYLKRQLNGQKSGVCVAGSDMVKQLPPRALGARDPRPWNCIYCGQPYTCLLTFTTHLKAHLLWLVGQCHVCQECGLSVSSKELLQRHLQTSHSATDNTLSQSLTSNMRRNIKSKVDMENEEEIDDPGKVGSYSSLKRISALPTNPIEGPHSCQICYKSFRKPQYFLRHLKKHSGDFTCQSCLKVFARKESLLKHICPSTKEDTSLSCTKCGRSFLNPNLLQQHQKKHEEPKKCEKCGYVVSSSEALQLHLTICPSVQVSKCYQCEVCGKQLATIKQLDKHRTRHRQQHHCHLCNKSYTNQSSLAKHLPLCRQSHQISSLGHVSCEECGKDFTDASAFRIHHHTHTRPYKCSVCNHRFQTRVGFEVHVCEVQQECDQCGTTFRSVQALNRHAAVHGPPPHSCKTCRRSFYRKESLVRHKCSVETKVKEAPKPKGKAPCICSVCGVQLANHRSLKKHLRSHGETDGKLLRCETCGKGFHRHDLLSQHQAVHKAPSLPCHTCNKLFKTQKSLEVHTLIHLNVKRFTCKYCNKKFHQKINLIRHERSHLPRGTVRCQYCSSHYSSSQELKAHLLSHTYPHEQEHVQSDPLDLIKKEAHRMEIETGEVLLPFTSSAVVESPLKYMSESKDLVSIESCRSDLLATSSDIHGSTDGLKLIVKEGTEGLKSEMDKDCMSLVPEFSTKVMHNVVINPQLTLQAAAADVATHSVFIPQGISNFSLSSESPLPSEYLASPITSPTNTPSPNHISNSSVFKVTNHSLTTDGCRLPPNYLISTTVPVLEDTIECHLGTSEEIVVTEQEVPLPSPSQSSEVRHLTLNPGPACLYQTAGGTVGTQVVQDCVSVVIVTEPTMDGC